MTPAQELFCFVDCKCFLSFSLSDFDLSPSTSHHFDHLLHNNNNNNHHKSSKDHNLDFHQNFHRQQRASHRQIFGAPEPHSSHHHHHGHQNNRLSNNDHLFGPTKTTSRPAGAAFISAWRSDDEHSNANLHRLSERWRRSRSNPPRDIHWRDVDLDLFRDDRIRNNVNRWRSTSHGALNDDSADDDWLGGVARNRLPGFGFRSSHDLHAANEARASRSDLRDIREQLLGRGVSHNDLRASRRNISKPWETECQTCTGALNRPGHVHRHNQNFHSYNPRSPSTDTDDLIAQRHQGVFRY